MPMRFAPARGASVLLSSSSRGPTGAAATIAVGTVTRLAEGATPTVTNTGTSAAATFAFGLPPGSTPATGFSFNTATTDSDKDAGDIWFNNATPASVTVIYFDNADKDANTVTAWLDSFDDSTSTHNGTLVFTPVLTPSAKLIYDVTGSVVDGTGYRKVTVTHVAGTTLPSDNAHIAVMFSRTGDSGTGTFPGSATDNAIVRFDGAGGATVQNSTVTVSDAGVVAGAVFGNTGLAVQDTNASHNLVIVPGSDLTANRNLTLTTGDAARTVTISGDATISQDYSTTGNPQFATVTLNNTGLHILDTNASHDLIIAPGSDLTADHTLTVTTGDADRTLTISGNATVSQDYSSTGSPTFANPVVTTVEVGHATDTTLARSAAGVLTVEGAALLKAGKKTIFMPASAMISRTTNGAASGTAEMATNKNMVKTLDFDTSTQEFAQFSVWFPKSWDLGTVTFQPTFSQLTTAAGGVVFGLAGVAVSDGDDLDVAFGTAQTSTKTAGTTNKEYQGPESSAITIAGTPAAGDRVMFQVNRTVADGSDTLAQDARLHGIRLFFTTNAATDL